MSQAETIHATCVAIAGRGVLLAGASGAGKSDLALRLIDRGATLVSDDYTVVALREGALHGSAPPEIAGRLEVRGIGVVDVAHLGEARLALFVALDAPVARMPEPARAHVAGGSLPAVALAALEPSAPIKVETALRLWGLTP